MSSDKLNVFVSYSHKDKAWLERVQVHLKPLARDGKLDLWDDTGIKTGQRWREEINTALARADVAVLLISADFYASDFIANNELPPLLEAARSERGLVIAGVHINYSRFDRDRVLSEYQTVNTPDRPIEDLPKAQQEKVFNDLARRIEELFDPPKTYVATSRARKSDRPMLKRLADVTVRTSQGVSGATIVLVLLAIVGTLVLVAGLAGDRIRAVYSNVVGGNVENSTIIIGPPSQEAKP